MSSLPRVQTIAIHILPNIARSKVNHTQNVVEKLFLERFLKNQKCAYFWIDSLKFYTV